MVFSQGERGKNENLLTFESEALSGQNVPKKDLLKNKYVTCMEDKLDKSVACLD